MIFNLSYFGVLPLLLGVRWSLADSDFMWSSSEEGKNHFDSSNSGLSLNKNEGTTLAFSLSELVLPSNDPLLSSYSLDEPISNSNSNSLFENPEDTTNPDFFSSDNYDSIGLIGHDTHSFELADCSSSSSSLFPPVNGKYRKKVKRIPGSPQSCPNPDSTPDDSNSFPPAGWRDMPSIINSLERSWDKVSSREELKHHSACVDLTLGQLPWGACSNPDPRYTTPTKGENLPWLGEIQLWYLDYCTPCMYSRIQNPPQRSPISWFLILSCFFFCWLT